jgi:hypothetical protein
VEGQGEVKLTTGPRPFVPVGRPLPLVAFDSLGLRLLLSELAVAPVSARIVVEEPAQQTCLVVPAPPPRVLEAPGPRSPLGLGLAALCVSVLAVGVWTRLAPGPEPLSVPTESAVHAAPRAQPAPQAAPTPYLGMALDAGTAAGAPSAAPAAGRRVPLSVASAQPRPPAFETAPGASVPASALAEAVLDAVGRPSEALVRPAPLHLASNLAGESSPLLIRVQAQDELLGRPGSDRNALVEEASGEGETPQRLALAIDGF